MSHRVTYETSRLEYPAKVADRSNPVEVWSTSGRVEVDDPKTLAAYLRGLADRLDPPKSTSSY